MRQNKPWEEEHLCKYLKLSGVCHQQRTTHGVTKCRGMSDDFPIPSYDIFQPNSSTGIKIRFFNHTVLDNAATDLRCAFLKFGNNESECPMDMAFTTF
ncbi:hypothetical protein CHS0354_008873 [Potamilus streckersoni]|uniref:Uncharacterized protein n=1 Tax=Potamilus streckersoni TaxID=2493646 RepID=A0AAE0RU69_9BIVA|nr:hypothetical protein CHS0354_008873 [Potamilus streckersoni]